MLSLRNPLSTFKQPSARLQAAGLATELSSTTAATIFAPTNAAFDTLLQNLGMSLDQLLANTTLIAEVLASAHLSSAVCFATSKPGAPSAQLGTAAHAAWLSDKVLLVSTPSLIPHEVPAVSASLCTTPILTVTVVIQYVPVTPPAAWRVSRSMSQRVS